MKAHLEARGEKIWDVVENGQFVLTSVVNSVRTIKIKSSWDEDDKKKVLYDRKGINIIQNALSMDGLFHVSQCTTEKQI